MQHIGTRATLVVLQSFVALTAVAGAIWVVPTLPPEWFGAPTIGDPLVPAIALGLVVGGSAIVAALTAVVVPHLASQASIIAGLMIIGFEAVEVVVVGFAPLEYGPQHPQSWLQVVYLTIGAIEVVLGYRLWVRTTADRAHDLRGAR